MTGGALAGDAVTGPRLAAVLRSEARVWVASPLRWSVAAAAGSSVLTALLLLGTGPPGWDRFLAYQNLWVVAVGPALAAVVAGWLARTETSCRRGGTVVRGVAPWRRRVGLLAVLGGWTALAHVAVLGAAVAMYVVTGSGATPVGEAVADAALLAAVLATSYVGYLAVLVVAGEVAGLLGCVVVGAVFSVVGVLTAESGRWWTSPPAWQVRPALPLIGTHANGIALDGQALPGTGTALGLAVALAVVVLAVAPTLTAGASGNGWGVLQPRRRAAPRVRTTGGRRVRGQTWVVATTVRGSAVPALAALAVVATLALLRWRPPGEVASFWALLVLPLGSALVPVLWVPRLREGLRAVATRRPDPARSGRGLLALMVALVSACSVVVALGLGAAGMATATAAGLGAVLCLTGCLLVCLSTWLVAVVGVAGCLFTTSCGVVVGLLVSGSAELTARVGYLVPWAWAGYPDAEHLVVTVPAALVGTLVLGALAARGMVATSRA